VPLRWANQPVHRDGAGYGAALTSEPSGAMAHQTLLSPAPWCRSACVASIFTSFDYRDLKDSGGTITAIFTVTNSDERNGAQIDDIAAICCALDCWCCTGGTMSRPMSCCRLLDLEW
jgi:hypothetical protein